jgi:hypothetical protein
VLSMFKSVLLLTGYKPFIKRYGALSHTYITDARGRTSLPTITDGRKHINNTTDGRTLGYNRRAGGVDNFYILLLT